MAMGELTFVVLLAIDAAMMISYFVMLKIKADPLYNTVIAGIATVISWGLSAACDTGILVGTETVTYEFWGQMTQGAMWLFILFTLYSFGTATVLKMRNDTGNKKEEDYYRRY